MQKDLKLEDLKEGLVRELFDYWLESRAGRLMPSREDMHPHEISHIMGNVMMFDVEEMHDGFNRLKCRLCGTNVVKACELDPTGYYLDNMPLHEGMSERLQWLIDHKRPYYHAGDFAWLGTSGLSYDAICLPLSVEGKKVDVILCCMSIYPTTQDGMKV